MSFNLSLLEGNPHNCEAIGPSTVLYAMRNQYESTAIGPSSPFSSLPATYPSSLINFGPKDNGFSGFSRNLDFGTEFMAKLWAMMTALYLACKRKIRKI
ncbi:hypothetical protein VNO77_37074 [Canavalia gladiata]|uniref:Uncharacterized protein n=1 Tax=Canavalia gladiata TaxID=3824 RepID=A0AAN9K8H7_CANGL